MKIRFLGAHNLVTNTTRTMTLLVDGVIALDAGCLASALSFKAQRQIHSVLLTHAHYDHTRDIPAFAMNLFLGGKSADFYCSPEEQNKVKAHLINGDTYPDFTLRPAEKPTVRFNLIEAESQFQVGQYRVKPVSLKHALPALGYQITDAAGRSFFYTGDTGPLTAETWQKINPDVLIIECTAPDKFKDMMTESGHLTPALLRDQLSLFKQIHSRLPRVYTVHTNPEYEAEIREQLRAVAWDTGAEITTAHEGLIIRV